MGKNCNKVKQTCNGENYAICVKYEGTVNAQSSLINDSCITIEETTQDIYNQLDTISTEDLGELCLTYTMEGGKLLVKNVLKKYEEKICELENKLNTIYNTSFWNIPIQGSGIDLKCLTTPCNTTIITVKDLVESLIGKVCEP